MFARFRYKYILFIFGIGFCGCIGPGDTSSEFGNGNVSGGSTSTEVVRSWRTPVVIDANTYDSGTANNNVVQGALVAGSMYFAASVVAASTENFHVLFSRATEGAAAANSVYMYATEPTAFQSDRWATSLAGFYQLDAGVGLSSIDSANPVSVVENAGNVVSMFYTLAGAAGNQRPFGVRRAYSSTGWTLPADLRAGAGDTTDIYRHSLALGADNIGNTVGIWCQNTGAAPTPYYNELRTYAGWRFSGATDAGTWGIAGGAQCNAADAGMGIGFDLYGRGLAAFTDNQANTTIQVQSWSSDNFDAAAPTAVAGADDDSFPRFFVSSDGAVFLFFYRQSDLAAGTATSVQMATGSSTSANLTVNATAFSAGGGGGNVQIKYSAAEGDYFPPLVRSKGTKAVAGFIQSDGTRTRLYLSRYISGSTWSSLKAVDSAVGDVIWADAAINAVGDIAVVYSSVYLGAEHVFVLNYKASSSSWTTPVRVTNVAGFSPQVAPAKTKPSIAIDGAGNAVAVFTYLTTAGATRRVFAVSYR